MKRKLVLFFLLAAVFAAAQSCKYLFKSDYAELKASDPTAYVDARFPDMYKRQIAQNEMVRKKFIDQYKKSFAFAQAAEAAGLQKSDDFKKLSEFRTEQILAAKYMESNPEVIVSKEECDAYYASHKDQFDSDLKFIATYNNESIPDADKERFRVRWSQMKTSAEKARQAKLDKVSGFAVLMKFEKADILADLYAHALQEKNKLTGEEKKKYLAEHPGADPDKLKEKAQGLLDRVKKGENFEKIADEFSEDPGSKGKGGDLGWFGKGIMDPAFEAAAFSLQKGQTTDQLVKSKFGYHIIRVDDRRTAPPATDPAHANGTPSPAQGQGQEPKEEIHARHILIGTRELEQFETNQVQDKVKREMEDATLKYKVSGPADFIVNVSGSDRNQIPNAGGGQGDSMHKINPGENK